MRRNLYLLALAGLGFSIGCALGWAFGLGTSEQTHDPIVRFLLEDLMRRESLRLTPGVESLPQRLTPDSSGLVMPPPEDVGIAIDVGTISAASDAAPSDAVMDDAPGVCIDPELGSSSPDEPTLDLAPAVTIAAF